MLGVHPAHHRPRGQVGAVGQDYAAGPPFLQDDALDPGIHSQLAPDVGQGAGHGPRYRAHSSPGIEHPRLLGVAEPEHHAALQGGRQAPDDRVVAHQPAGVWVLEQVSQEFAVWLEDVAQGGDDAWIAGEHPGKVTQPSLRAW